MKYVNYKILVSKNISHSTLEKMEYNVIKNDRKMHLKPLLKLEAISWKVIKSLPKIINAYD